MLSILFDSPAKVKEILREKSKEMDATENVVLFGEKFREELQRDSATKLKTKNLFSGLKPKTPAAAK